MVGFTKLKGVCASLAALLLLLSVVYVPAALASGTEYYVAKSDSSGAVGDGTMAKPFRGLAQAMEKVSNGDTLVLTEDILHAEETPGGGFTFKKSVTIKGNSHTLTFRGTELFFDADVNFDSLSLSVVPNGTEQTNLWAQGHDLSFANVTTKLTGVNQNDWRPIIYTGSKTGSTTGKSTITISGGNSESRFKQIVIGDAQAGSGMSATVVIDSQFAQVDQGIQSTTSGEVSVTSKSSNVKKFSGNVTNPNESVIFDGVKVYSADLSGIDNVTLKGTAEVTPTSVSSSYGKFDIEEGAQLLLNNANVKEVNVGSIAGSGRIVLGADSTLKADSVDGAVTVEARVWNDSDREKLLAREFFTATTVNAEPKVLVKKSGEETPVAKNAEGKWLGAAESEQKPPTPPAAPAKIEFSAPKDPVVLPDGQRVDAAYVYKLLTPPAGVTVGPEQSKPNTVVADGKYRGYLYTDSTKLPAVNQFGRFTINVFFVDDVMNTKQQLVVTLVRNKPVKPEDTSVTSEWIDSTEADAKSCETKKVKQTQTKTNTTYVWSDESGTWLARTTQTSETRLRDMNDAELQACAVKPADIVETSEWADGTATSDWDYTEHKVTQYRTVVTTPYKWDSTTHMYVPDPDKAVSEKQSQKRDMTSSEVKAGTPRPQDVVAYGAWSDIAGSNDCASLTVKQTRTVTTTSHVWNGAAKKWELDSEHAIVTQEERTRMMNDQEKQLCAPPAPTPKEIGDITAPYSNVGAGAHDPASCSISPYVKITQHDHVTFTLTIDGKSVPVEFDNGVMTYEYPYGSTAVVKAAAEAGYQFAGGVIDETWQWTAPTRDSLNCTPDQPQPDKPSEEKPDTGKPNPGTSDTTTGETAARAREPKIEQQAAAMRTSASSLSETGTSLGGVALLSMMLMLVAAMILRVKRNMR